MKNKAPEESKEKFEKLTEKYKIPLAGIGTIRNYSIDELSNKEKIFQAASISKCLTAFCVMRFVEEGKLDLKKDVNNYLKFWKVRNRKGKLVKVTLKQLLSHTAGIYCTGFEGHKKQKTLFPRMFRSEKPVRNEETFCKYKKGEFHYSGGGYMIIQKILEDVSDQRFSKIMKEKVLRPLDMKKSAFSFPISRNFVTGYSNGKKVHYHFHLHKAAAGLWTTSEDLCKFIIEIQKSFQGESELLSKKFARKMLKPVVKAEGNFMGLGFFITKDKKQFYHTGHNVGFGNKFLADFKGEGIVILTNEGNSKKFIKEVIKEKTDLK